MGGTSNRLQMPLGPPICEEWYQRRQGVGKLTDNRGNGAVWRGQFAQTSVRFHAIFKAFMFKRWREKREKLVNLIHVFNKAIFYFEYVSNNKMTTATNTLF